MSEIITSIEKLNVASLACSSSLICKRIFSFAHQKFHSSLDPSFWGSFCSLDLQLFLDSSIARWSMISEDF
ncbi:hypothetical protein EUTSA_v10019409mg [Eutrema salsugineum]|uniref:Uncharacterized protein n=1 Tax=Eutrema salsugineum TaxID=72664 RepID=V4KKP2_EUTSA|nr:hypothetical protein EUTSA_v10019409mg [Eutrema salsugineum]